MIVKSFKVLFFFLVLTSTVSAAELYEKCMKCHQVDGRSWVDEIVTLTGQNKEYLVTQLYRFKTKERTETLLYVMNDIAASLTEDEIDRIATHYSQQNPQNNFPKQPPMNAEEKKLYNIGKHHSQVCMSCHSEAEARPVVRGDWPYISGQNQPAIVIQLNAFASGKRKNPMMDFIKSPPFNNPEVIEGLALFFSRQRPPVPAIK